MTTANSRIAALNSSCPEPAAKSLISSANAATQPAASTPHSTPSPTQRRLPGTPRLAASTMPTISAASRTSRKTTIALASMGAYFATTWPCAVAA